MDGDRVIGIAGVGKMGEALVRGLVTGRVVPPSRVFVSDAVPSRAREIAAKYGVGHIETTSALAERSDVEDAERAGRDRFVRLERQRHPRLFSSTFYDARRDPSLAGDEHDRNRPLEAARVHASQLHRRQRLGLHHFERRVVHVRHQRQWHAPCPSLG